ncbi:MAG: ATP-binding cassette domain-containing protein [Polyangiaceae bacterium]|nr:ATP-binding cassette domain-containing protein [Polyangiaceae bacterium]
MDSQPPVLLLRSYGLAFDHQVVLSDVTLTIPPSGIVVLMGPSGTGKSSLLRTLAGLNDAQPSLRTWGEAHYLDGPLSQRNRPVMVLQHARLLTASVLENIVCTLPNRDLLTRGEQVTLVSELLARFDLEHLSAQLSSDAIDLSLGDQRVLSIIRGVASGAALVLVDEPTFALEPEAEERVLDVLMRAAAERALLVVTHNQRHARRLSDDIALLAGGRVVERGAVLTAPGTEAGREFLSTGNTSLASPGADPSELAPGVPAPAPLPRSASLEGPSAPRHFYWLVPGRLAGTPRPGIIDPVRKDLERLASIGVTLLVCLEEEPPISEALLTEFGLRSVHIAVVDMQPPTIETAEAFCAQVTNALTAGEVVAVHCLAGLGRTGTALALYLVSQGVTSLEAIDTIRALRPWSIQTAEQADFISRFERLLHGAGPPAQLIGPETTE